METNLLQYTIEQAEYPAYPAYVDPQNYFRADGGWDSEGYRKAQEDYRRALEALGKSGADAAPVLAFADDTAGPVLLRQQGKNGVYSPVSLYTAMAMLAELCSGESRAQVLSVLGGKEPEALREEVHRLWLESYCDSGVVTCRMGSSVWLNEQVDFRAETLQALAQHYFASAYRVTMGTEEADRAIAQWVNEQTGGLLQAEAGNIRTEPLTLLQLYTTLYFKARWQDTFAPERTEAGLFHLYDADGASVTCDFMHRSARGGYRRGEGYTAAVLPFAEGGGSMVFCLPEGDTNVEELLRQPRLVSQLRQMTDYGAMIHWTVPKFDVRSTTQLNEVLQTLGVEQVFGDEADFSALTETFAYLDSVQQSARVKIDEEGVEAAAFTQMAVCGMSLPHEEIFMTLDRPFLFAIYDGSGLPLFVGTVYRPE